jgi:hypothetical protein
VFGTGAGLLAAGATDAEVAAPEGVWSEEGEGESVAGAKVNGLTDTLVAPDPKARVALRTNTDARTSGPAIRDTGPRPLKDILHSADATFSLSIGGRPTAAHCWPGENLSRATQHTQLAGPPRSTDRLSRSRSASAELALRLCPLDAGRVRLSGMTSATFRAQKRAAIAPAAVSRIHRRGKHRRLRRSAPSTGQLFRLNLNPGRWEPGPQR